MKCGKLETEPERRFATAIRNNTESPYRFIQDPNGKERSSDKIKMDRIEEYQKKIEEQIEKLKQEQEILEKRCNFARRLKSNRAYMDNERDDKRRLRFLRDGSFSDDKSHKDDIVYQRLEKYQKTHRGGMNTLAGVLICMASDCRDKLINRKMQEKEYNLLLNCSDEEFRDYFLWLAKELVRSRLEPFSYYGMRGEIESAHYLRDKPPSL